MAIRDLSALAAHSQSCRWWPLARSVPLIIENFSKNAAGTCSGEWTMCGAQKRKRGVAASCALIVRSTWAEM